MNIVSSPYLLNLLKDFRESLVKCSSHEPMTPHCRVKVMGFTFEFRVRSISLTLERFSLNFSKIQCSSHEPMTPL